MFCLRFLVYSNGYEFSLRVRCKVLVFTVKVKGYGLGDRLWIRFMVKV